MESALALALDAVAVGDHPGSALFDRLEPVVQFVALVSRLGSAEREWLWQVKAMVRVGCYGVAPG